MADPNWNNVSALLSFDGSEGGTSFPDDSDNNHSVTVNGGTHTSATGAKFAQSGVFDGSGDYLELPDHSSLDLFDSGDFTIEWWMELDSGVGIDSGIWSQGTNSNNRVDCWWYYWDEIYVLYRSGGSQRLNLSVGATITSGWHHIAVVRSGTTWTIYVDGTAAGNGSQSGAGDPGGQFTIGRTIEVTEDYNGKLDEFRITKGVARYTANFTPPTAPFERGGTGPRIAEHIASLLYRDRAEHIAELDYKGFEVQHIAPLPIGWYHPASHIAPLTYPLDKAHTAALEYRDRAYHDVPLEYVRLVESRAPLAYSIPGTKTHVAALPYRDQATHQAPLELPRIAYRRTHSAPLEIRGLRLASHQAPLPFLLRADHIAPIRYSRTATHGAALDYVAPSNAAHGAPLRYSLATAHLASLSFSSGNPGRASHRAPMAIYAAEPLAMNVDVKLLRDGEELPMISCTLSRSQGQTYWSADIELARLEDYHRLPLARAFTVQINATDYNLIVDRRQLTRDGPASKRPAIRGLSACALQDAPFADAITRTWEDAALASAIVAEVLPGLSVTWNMVDWVIPAYRLAVDGMTPMAIAADIVTAAGGQLEALPDGNLLARPSYPVTVPDMESAASDALLSAYDDIYDTSESMDAARGNNRVRVYDSSPDVTLDDTLEWIADEDDARAGTLRAYPSPWRETLTIRHSRGDPVTLERLGPVTRTIESELVEIQAGSGTARYPIVALQAAAYEADDLGAITFEPYTKELRTATEGYSLLRIDYSTKSIDYRALADADVVAQMILEDPDG